MQTNLQRRILLLIYFSPVLCYDNRKAVIFLDGIFLRKKFNIWLLLLLICGLAFIGLYVFLRIVDPTASVEIVTFLVVGIVICAVVFPSWLLNFRAFLHLDEETIQARYHWFGRIDCKLSDVDFASARINTLVIRLKDGKCHTIMGIENPWTLCAAIRRKISFSATEEPGALIEKLNRLKATRRKLLVCVYVGIVLMFLNIFLTVFLTGSRELQEFCNTDWIVMAIMGVIETVITAATFCFAYKAGKYNIPAEQLHYTIQRTLVETTPLLPGNAIKVLTDENYAGRITLFGYPNTSSVYYFVERVTPDYSLVQTYESKIFEDISQISEELDAFWDISEKFPQ